MSVKHIKWLGESRWPGGRRAAVGLDVLMRAAEGQGLNAEEVRAGKQAVPVGPLRLRVVGRAFGNVGARYTSAALVMREGLRARASARYARVKHPLANALLRVEGRLYRIPDGGDIPRYSLTSLVLGPVYEVGS